MPSGSLESSTYGRVDELTDRPETIIFNHFAADWNCAFSRKTKSFIKEILEVRKEKLNATLVLDPLFIQSALVAKDRTAMYRTGKTSSGWTGIYLLSHSCNVINAFGFCPNISSDYKRLVHDVSGEHKHYLEWSQRRGGPFKLNLYPPIMTLVFRYLREAESNHKWVYRKKSLFL